MPDIRVFNFFILTIYAITAIWWGFHGYWNQMLYWIFAFGITAVVTYRVLS